MPRVFHSCLRPRSLPTASPLPTAMTTCGPRLLPGHTAAAHADIPPSSHVHVTTWQDGLERAVRSRPRNRDLVASGAGFAKGFSSGSRSFKATQLRGSVGPTWGGREWSQAGLFLWRVREAVEGTFSGPAKTLSSLFTTVNSKIFQISRTGELISSQTPMPASANPTPAQGLQIKGPREGKQV